MSYLNIFMSICGIYKITNKINNKKYIGITCRPPEIRWNHGRGYLTNKHFWRVIEKDG